MKANIFQIFRQTFFLFGAILLITFVSCEKEADPAPEPVASFQYDISEDNYLEVSFTSFSQNAVSHNWNFGDGATSTEENPTHTYEEAGSYEVRLAAENSDGVVSTFSETIEITDPDEALKLLTGETSKTWKLYREGTSMGVGENMDNLRGWWALENDGTRPCMYFHEFTFHLDGSYVFDDKGSFWGEGGVFREDLVGECLEAVPANMVGADGEDLSAWLGGTHAFEYNSSTGMVTLTGEGAWIGLPKVATDGEVTVPQNSVTFEISIEEHSGYDEMHVLFVFPDGVVWDFSYVSYSDSSLEPDVVEEQESIEDLESITPDELGHTFESETSFDLLGSFDGASVITTGVDDPDDATATKVGRFDRTDAQYQEAQLRGYPEPKNIQFDNFSTVSVDVYLPGANTYDPLTRKVIIGFGDVHTTSEWWNRLIQYESDELELDEWVTVTFNLDTPSFSSAEGETVFDRDDLDMIFIQIGGGNHTSEGTFYIRNFRFE